MNDDERLEQLALDCFDRMEHEGDAALVFLSTEHPEDAAAIRRIVGQLSRVGLMSSDSCERVAVGHRLGDFRFERLLGAGGMGVVWLATQESLGRRVALKLMRPGVLPSRRSRERFQREIELLSRQDHPGICTVYEAGEIEDTPYLAMRFVDGESLAARIQGRREDRGSTSTAEHQWMHSSVDLVEKVARALHSAHEAGVIHRDVKPANVMIDAGGEPVVLDFGLARSDENGQRSLTQSGNLLGTPVYMAPEQIRGEPMDRRCDVYSLGVMLYECVLLQCPFTDANRESLYRQILAGDVQAPRSQRRKIGGDLLIVIQRAMALDPKDRFATAAEFADELVRILRHEPILTRRPGPGLRLYRWTQRNPLATSALLVISAALALSLYLLADNARTRSERRAFAEAMAAAHDARENPILGFQRAREALQHSDNPVVVQELQAIMGELHQIKRLDEHEGRVVRSVAYSPDGKFLVTASEAWLSAPILHDALSGEKICKLEMLARPWGIAIAPDSSLIAVGGTRRNESGVVYREAIVRLFDSRGTVLGDLLHEVLDTKSKTQSIVICVRFSPQGDRLLACGSDGTASLWAQEGEKWRRVKNLVGGHAGPIWEAAFSRDGNRIITAGGSGTTGSNIENLYDVCIWDGDGDLLKTLHDHAHTIWSIAAGKTCFATASHDGTLRFWSFDGTPLRPPFRDSGAFTSVFADRTGERFVSTAMSGKIRIHDRSGKVLTEWLLPGRKSSAIKAAFSPDGRFVAVAGTKQFVDVFDLDGKLLVRLRGHLQVVTDVAFSPTEGSRLASASYDGSVRLWSIDPLCPGIVTADETGVRDLLPLGNDGRVLAAGWKSGRVTIWKDAKKLFEDPGEGKPMRCVGSSRSRDGNRIALSYVKGKRENLGEIRIYDVSGKKRVLQVAGSIQAVLLHPDEETILFSQGGLIGALDLREDQPKPVRWGSDRIRQAAIQVLELAPDGQELVTGNLLGGCRIWDLDTRKRTEGSFMGAHRTHIRSCLFSADGEMLLTGSLDGTARLWDLRTFQELQLYEGHHGSVLRACFSPDEKQVLTASGDDTLRLWDRKSGTMLLELRGHAANVSSACFVAGGSQVVSASMDGTLRWWWLRPEDLRRVSKRLADRLAIPELSQDSRR